MSVTNRFVNTAGSVIRNQHRSRIVRLGARICRCYLNYYWNDSDWNFRTNGELLLLRTLAGHWNNRQTVTVLDVGVNVGSYMRCVRQAIPNGIVYCFEIVPGTRKTLAANVADLTDVNIAECGLSNDDGYLKIGYQRENDDKARDPSWLSGDLKEVVNCKVMAGDNYLEEQQIKSVNLLKIDAEGNDIAVLEGFTATIEHAWIAVIQFEYGATWIAPGRFLHEAYALLEPAGFRIGRLYPDGVCFKSYDRNEDENFRMGNYVAVQSTLSPIIKALNLNYER